MTSDTKRSLRSAHGQRIVPGLSALLLETLILAHIRMLGIKEKQYSQTTSGSHMSRHMKQKFSIGHHIRTTIFDQCSTKTKTISLLPTELLARSGCYESKNKENPRSGIFFIL